MNESLSVLVVDDDISIQNVVEEILSDGGFEPKAASSGEEAIALLNAHRFRAVIIDIAFGKDRVKGWAVARRARAFNPALPIIYITDSGGAEQHPYNKAVSAGAASDRSFTVAHYRPTPSDRTLKSAFPLRTPSHSSSLPQLRWIRPATTR